jgi:hypothetical protein
MSTVSEPGWHDVRWDGPFELRPAARLDPMAFPLVHRADADAFDELDQYASFFFGAPAYGPPDHDDEIDDFSDLEERAVISRARRFRRLAVRALGFLVFAGFAAGCVRIAPDHGDALSAIGEWASFGAFTASRTALR